MDRIFVASTFMRDLMLHNGFAPDKVRLLPYFCPMPGNTATQALQPGSRLLFVGQLQRYKGLSVLLAAMKRLPHSVTLDVAGDGPRLREYQGRCSDWGLQGRVAFHGWLNRDAVSQLMQEVQVVVVPSIWNEPFGIVGLEAMFHGRPVVAFDVGGIREWLVDQETGVLVPDLNEQSLSVAIAELLGNLPRAEAMGRNGARRVRERFTAASHITRLLGDFTAISQSAQYGPTT
jgi:glycosyltransferase involved in cell wall biosynthesis